MLWCDIPCHRDMDDGTDGTTDRRSTAHDEPDGELEASTLESEGIGATGVYETEDGVVLYDVDEPLAWVQSDTAVTLAEMA